MREQSQIGDIIEGCTRNNQQAQKMLYEMYSAKLFAVCLVYAYDRSDAEDILHDGFIKILTNIKQYKGDGSFEGWMRKIMVNTALEKYRRDHKMMAIAENIKSMVEMSVEDIIGQITTSEIMEAVQSLSPQYRVVFMLYAVEGYNHKEIGAMLDITEGTSKSNLSRARSILQDKIRQIYGHRLVPGRVIQL